MTRPSKKEHERRLASRFLEGLDYTSLEEDERPDLRVRRVEGDFGLEVTEYHSQTPEGDTGRPRVAVEVAWRRYLESVVNNERQTRPSLKNIHAYFRFADRHLPGKAQGAFVARELVGAVEAAVADARFLGNQAMVEFAPRTQIESFGNFRDGTECH